MGMMDSLAVELEQESVATRRHLERVPADKLDWRPHPKSMSLGQLALHVASTPGAIADLLGESEFDASQTDFQQAPPESYAQIMQVFEEALASTKETLSGMDDAEAMSPWTLRRGDAEIFTVPKIGLARTLLLNHLYHHRGQLGVYLRLLDVAVPSTFGPSADENPFA